MRGGGGRGLLEKFDKCTVFFYIIRSNLSKYRKIPQTNFTVYFFYSFPKILFYLLKGLILKISSFFIFFLLLICFCGTDGVSPSYEREKEQDTIYIHDTVYVDSFYVVYPIHVINGGLTTEHVLDFCSGKTGPYEFLRQLMYFDTTHISNICRMCNDNFLESF